MKKHEPMWIIFMAGLGAGFLHSFMGTPQSFTPVWFEWLGLTFVLAFVSMLVFKMIVEFQN